jgi:hypothetical protein
VLDAVFGIDRCLEIVLPLEITRTFLELWRSRGAYILILAE